ncbi:restriction endonuclease subunit S, partial [Fulvivirga sp. RKSG066]|uniref:restriction endonuclease subunit S n=1 Tax=Fulvivirga aurantia TaxID=2529383 RepID=UPI0016232803
VDQLSPRTGGQTGVDVPMLKEYPILLPDRDYQKKVEGVLTSFDNKISLNNRINKELEAMAKLIYDYWFVQFEFPISKEQAAAMDKPELEGKPYKSSGGKMVYNEQLKREIPEGWEVKKLRDMVSIRKESIQPDEIPEHTPYVGLEHIPRKTLILDEWTTDYQLNSQKFQFQTHDILFGKIRPYFHKVSLAFINGITSSDTIVIEAIDKVNLGIISHIVSSDEFVEISVKSSTGTKMPRANWGVMQDYQFAYDHNTSVAFNNSFSQFIGRMRTGVLENQHLTELRNWLLPMLMNGQVRVSASEFSGLEDEQNLSMAAEEKEGYGDEF